MADNDNKTCAHDMCDCRTQGEADYCSDHCRDVEDQKLVEISCDCGHPGCNA